MKNKINWFVQEESGQGLVEYSLILTLVVIVAIGGLKVLKSGVSDLYEKIRSTPFK